MRRPYPCDVSGFRGPHRDRVRRGDRRETASECVKNGAPMGLASKTTTAGKLATGRRSRTVPGGPRPGRTRMIEIIKILKIKKLGGFRLYLYFSDGTEGEWDFAI